MEWTEKDIEKRFCKGIREKGGLPYKFTSPGNAGVPDRLVILPNGSVHFVELKRPGGKLRPLQLLQKEKIESRNGKYYVISTIDEVNKYLDGI